MNDNFFLELCVNNLANTCTPDIIFKENFLDNRVKVLFYGFLPNGKIMPIVLIITNECYQYVKDIIKDIKNKDDYKCSIKKIEEKYKSDKCLYTIEIDSNGIEKPRINELQTLWISEKDIIYKSLENVIKYENLCKKITVVDYTLNKLLVSIEEYNSSNIDTNQLNYTIASLMKSYLTEFVSYRDITKKILKVHYPNQVELLNTLTNDALNNNYDYLYVLELRNALTHCLSLPFEKANSYLDENMNQKTNFIMGNRYYIKSYTEMKTKLKTKLNSNLDAEVNVVEVITDAYKTLLNIHAKIMQEVLNHETYEEMLFLLEIKKKYNEYDNFFIGYMNKKNLEWSEIELNLDEIPIDFIKALLKNTKLKIK